MSAVRSEPTPEAMIPAREQKPPKAYPTTPDGRYFIVRGRLWRCSNPTLDPQARATLVAALMAARRAVAAAKRGNGDMASARAQVDAAKRALGERGPVWWRDGAPA